MKILVFPTLNKLPGVFPNSSMIYPQSAANIYEIGSASFFSDVILPVGSQLVYFLMCSQIWGLSFGSFCQSHSRS